MLTSSGSSPARAKSRRIRGMSFFGCSGSRKPRSGHAAIRGARRSLRLPRACASVARRRRRRVRVRRHAQLVGEHLHRGGEIERRIVRIRRESPRARLHLLTSSVVSPLVSLPNTSATGCARATSTSRAAASRAVIAGTAISRARAEHADRERDAAQRFFERLVHARRVEHVARAQRAPFGFRVGKALRRHEMQARRAPSSSSRAPPRRCCRDGWARRARCECSRADRCQAMRLE